MLKLTRSLKALILFSLVLVSLITRVLVGHGGYANPIHRYAGPTMEASSSMTIEVGDSVFHTFKLKRKIALETLTHFPWYLSSTVSFIDLCLICNIDEHDDKVHDLILSLHLRPPTQA